MNDRSLILSFVIVLSLICVWHLFLRDISLAREETITTRPSNKLVERYLKTRLRELEKQSDKSEGFMQALDGYSNVLGLDNKIRDLDRQYENSKHEQHKIIKLLKAMKQSTDD